MVFKNDIIKMLSHIAKGENLIEVKDGDDEKKVFLGRITLPTKDTFFCRVQGWDISDLYHSEVLINKPEQMRKKVHEYMQSDPITVSFNALPPYFVYQL